MDMLYGAQMTGGAQRQIGRHQTVVKTMQWAEIFQGECVGQSESFVI